MKGIALEYIFFTFLFLLVITVGIGVIRHFYRQAENKPIDVNFPSDVKYTCLYLNDTRIDFRDFQDVLYGFLAGECDDFQAEVTEKITFDDIKRVVDAIDPSVQVVKTNECVLPEIIARNVYVNFTEILNRQQIKLTRNGIIDSGVIICDVFETPIETTTVPSNQVIYWEDTTDIGYESYKRLNLENNVIRVSFLPELGGRVYEFIYKKTGHNQFYKNPVRKPTTWGTNECRLNGNWEAIGGIEFAFPTEEHGTIWDQSWNYEMIDNTGGSKTVKLYHTVQNCNNHDLNGLMIEVKVTVFPDRKDFEIKSTISNPTSTKKRYQYWINAMLTPGGSNPLESNIEFIFPTSEMIVHGSGDDTLPHTIISWPQWKSLDYSRYSNWNHWLGVFVPNVESKPNYVGIFNHDSSEGIVRRFPNNIARGSKLFAHSNQIPVSVYTIDGGYNYIEIWGGLTPTFWDWSYLDPDQSVEWSETWGVVDNRASIS
jgi:hypothetical protein